MKKALLTGHNLIKRAEELGIYIYTDDANVAIGTKSLMAPVVPESEIQRRVMEAERHFREHTLWIVTIISAATALVSAIAAWAAVFSKSF